MRREIVLVEDHPDTRSLIAKILKSSGYRVREYSCPLDAMAELNRHVQVLITDIALPVMRGDDFARLMKSSNPDARIIGISGCMDNAVGGPFDRFLKKPFRKSDLLRAVKFH